MPDTGWKKEAPMSNGMYRWRADERDYEPEMHEVADGLVFRIESRRSEPVENYGGEWLGPISPSDFEQLVRLREVAENMAQALKEAGFAYHVEARHKPAFAVCNNSTCANACRLFNQYDAALETKP